jgi:hypothetical protein
MPPTSGSAPPRCFNHREGKAADTARSRARKAGGRVRGKQQTAAAIAEAARPGTTTNPPGPIVYEAKPWHWWELYGPADVEEGLAHVAREVIAGRMPSRQAAVAVKALQTLLPIAQQAHEDGERPYSSLEENDDETDSAGLDA